jgi:hypothetical protein
MISYRIFSVLFFWTAAARGIKHGFKNYPTDKHTRQMPVYPNNAGTPKLQAFSFYEAVLVDIAEVLISRVVAKWEGKRHKLKTKAKMLQQRFDERLKECRKIISLHKSRDFRLPDHSLSKTAYYIVFLSALLGETIFNASAFLVLRLPDFETYIIGGALSLYTMILAHTSAITLKQWKKMDSRRRELAIGVASLVTVLLGIITVSLIRINYLSLIGKGQWGYLEIFEFATLNLTFAAAGFASAWHAHDADPVIEAIPHQKRIARKRRDCIWKKWNLVASRYDMIKALTNERIEQIKNDLKSRIDEYRLYNVTVRSSTPPHHFGELVCSWYLRPRDLGPDLDTAPPKLDECLRNDNEDDTQVKKPQNEEVS